MTESPDFVGIGMRQPKRPGGSVDLLPKMGAVTANKFNHHIQ